MSGREMGAVVLIVLVSTAPAGAIDVKVTQNTSKLMPFQVFELTFQHDGKYKDPTFDVTIDVTFTSPGATPSVVGGFFYGSSVPQAPVLTDDRDRRGRPIKRATWPSDPADLWKARFAPAELGEWKYDWMFRDVAGERAAGSGKLTVVGGRVRQRGFVRISPENPFRFVFDDGTPFWPVGWQDGVGDGNHNGSCMDTRGVEGPFRPDPDGTRPQLPAGPMFVRGRGMGPVNGDVDFGRHARAGFNLWRFSPHNNSMNVFYARGSRKYAGIDEIDWMDARQVDELLLMTRKYGMVNFYGIFGFTPAENQKPPDKRDMDKVKRLIKYSVDRWGATVDFWELFNEQKADAAWYAVTVPYLKSIDPYHHIVTTSWEHPEIDGIDVSAPHWYGNEDELVSPQAVEGRARPQKKFRKPVVFGEQGNSVGRQKMGVDGWGGVWDPGSGRRMRARLWSALFNEVALVFWETSYAKDGHYMNLWVGPEERQYVKALQDFSSKLDGRVKTFTPELGGAGARVTRSWGLRSERCVAVYLFHSRCDECGKSHNAHPPGGRFVWDHDRGEVKDLTVTVDVPPSPAGAPASAGGGPRAMKGYWYDPATARILATFDAPAGRGTFTAPAFTIDLALLISDRGPIDSDGDGRPNDLDDDDDNDGVPDVKDAWPLEREEWADADGDRIGDNVDADLDADGKADDRNRNGVPDNEEKDWDGDGVPQGGALPWDAFPRDPKEWRDTDGDGIGDNADTDDDGDGYSDAEEKAAGTDPLDPVSFP